MARRNRRRQDRRGGARVALNLDEAAAELDAIGQSADQMLLDLDVPECVPQADGGSA